MGTDKLSAGVTFFPYLDELASDSGGNRDTPSRFILLKSEISAGRTDHLSRMQTLPFYHTSGSPMFTEMSEHVYNCLRSIALFYKSSIRVLCSISFMWFYCHSSSLAQRLFSKVLRNLFVIAGSV